jgi:hypothetical protein
MRKRKTQPGNLATMATLGNTRSYYWYDRARPIPWAVLRNMVYSVLDGMVSRGILREAETIVYPATTVLPKADVTGEVTDAEYADPNLT